MMVKSSGGSRSSSSAFLLLSLLGVVSVVAQQDSTKGAGGGSGGPPVFFLQDPTDSLCLDGEIFKRCSIDTLLYAKGDPGHFQIFKRPHDGIIEDDDNEDIDDELQCLTKQKCNDMKTKSEEIKLAKCSHCGAKNWNILGDGNVGYALTLTAADADDAETDAEQTGGGVENNRVCLKREKDSNKGLLVPCDLESAVVITTNPDDMTYTPLMLQFISQSEIAGMSSPGARLVTAASDGDKKAIQQMLKDGIVDINYRDWDQLTALIPAATNGDLDLMKYLISEGIDVNAGDKDGITALMEAATMGHVKVVEYLLSEAKVVDDVNQKSKGGITALWLASGQGKTDVVRVLLKNGAEVNVQRNDGLSAVMTAAVGGHVDCLKLLIENGADIMSKDQDDVTPLMNAAEGGNLDVVKVLVDKIKEIENGSTDHLDHISKTGFSALIIAAAQGRDQVVEYLLEAGADPNKIAEETSGVTAFMYAASHNHVNCCKVLLEKGKVDVNLKHSNGGTALSEAATSGAGDVVVYLVKEAGADVDIMDGDGVTPLMAVSSNVHKGAQQAVLEAVQAMFKDKPHQEFLDYMNKFSLSGGNAVMFAAASGQHEFCKQLIDLGAIVTQQAKADPEYVARVRKNAEEAVYQPGEQQPDPHIDGLTALHVAAQGGHLETVKLLLTLEDMKVDLKDELGRTALILAVKGNFGEIATLLIDAGADPNTPYLDDKDQEHNLLFDSIMVENVKFAKALISNGANLYYKDDKSVTTLLQASHRGLTEIVELLLEKHKESSDADDNNKSYLDDASEEGIRPLIAAASEGHIEVVKLLLAHGADVNVQDNDETTALMAASARGHVEVVQELLNANADIDSQNRDGHTALMFAYNGKNQVETLWERFSQFNGSSKRDGGTGPIIREALDNHTALVDLLLKSGANTKLKDKEGHVAKDLDYHPDTDSEILDKEVKKEAARDGSKEEL